MALLSKPKMNSEIDKISFLLGSMPSFFEAQIIRKLGISIILYPKLEHRTMGLIQLLK